MFKYADENGISLTYEPLFIKIATSKVGRKYSYIRRFDDETKSWVYGNPKFWIRERQHKAQVIGFL